MGRTFTTFTAHKITRGSTEYVRVCAWTAQGTVYTRTWAENDKGWPTLEDVKLNWRDDRRNWDADPSGGAAPNGGTDYKLA